MSPFRPSPVVRAALATAAIATLIALAPAPAATQRGFGYFEAAGDIGAPALAGSTAYWCALAVSAWSTNSALLPSPNTSSRQVSRATRIPSLRRSRDEDCKASPSINNVRLESGVPGA